MKSKMTKSELRELIIDVYAAKSRKYFNEESVKDFCKEKGINVLEATDMVLYATSQSAFYNADCLKEILEKILELDD